MDILIPRNPWHPGITLNVWYCSDVTIAIVALSAANYLNSTLVEAVQCISLSFFLHKLLPTENKLCIRTFIVPVTGDWAVTDR